ncbi:MAG TPA: hypothetical protein EYP68_07285 [Candidatus Korarchaeota archaeon]|nr:hypothetical protein [Candidatus Korarchaeota archaeon]
MKSVLRNRSLIIGFTFLLIAFVLSLLAVMPETHRISGEEALLITNSTIVRLNRLNELGSAYGGLWGNMTFLSTDTSNLTLKLRHVNGTEYKESILLASDEPVTIPIEGLTPIEMIFLVPKESAGLTYSYCLVYYSYPSSPLGIIAAIFSVVGAVFGLRGLFYHVFRPQSESI